MAIETVPPSAESISEKSGLRMPPQVLLSPPTVGSVSALNGVTKSTIYINASIVVSIYGFVFVGDLYYWLRGKILYKSASRAMHAHTGQIDECRAGRLLDKNPQRIDDLDKRARRLQDRRKNDMRDKGSIDEFETDFIKAELRSEGAKIGLRGHIGGGVLTPHGIRG